MDLNESERQWVFPICCNTTRRTKDRIIRGACRAGSVGKRVAGGNGLRVAQAPPYDDASKGSEAYRCGFPKNGFVQLCLGQQLLQSSILFLQLLQTLCLIRPDSTVFFPPAVIGVVGHTDLPTLCRDVLPLRKQNFRFPKLPGNLFTASL